MKKIFSVFLVISFGTIGSIWALNDNGLNIKEKYGSECKIIEKCDDMLYVDCGAAVDGPAYYLDKAFEIIGTSGGICTRGCSGAPEEWTQCTERNSASSAQPKN